jgi:hypothetical protein
MEIVTTQAEVKDVSKQMVMAKVGDAEPRVLSREKENGQRICSARRKHGWKHMQASSMDVILFLTLSRRNGTCA